MPKAQDKNDKIISTDMLTPKTIKEFQERMSALKNAQICNATQSQLGS